MAGDKLPLLPPERSSWMDNAFRPLRDFYLWCQVVDQKLRELFSEAATNLADIATALGNKAARVQIVPWAHTHGKVKDGTYFLARATLPGTLDTTYTDCTSGTCTVRWAINGVNVGSTANSVSSTAQTQTHSSAKTFAIGDVISYTITSNSACLNALLQANVTLTQVA